ncbi:hypothetical protein HZS_4344 [Henneguya salminicola]|nr:hypothetical protein HZS_4344 [Henneguya salminicola]
MVSLGIKMPIFVMIIKNVNRYFSFELKVFRTVNSQVKDDSDTVRHLRASNYEYKTRIHQHICTFPLILESGWNVVTLNIIEILKKIYSSNYVETISVQIHGNCRLRRVYFSDRVYSEDELTSEFKLFLPSQQPDGQIDSAKSTLEIK